jgi:hypothetical protein
MRHSMIPAYRVVHLAAIVLIVACSPASITPDRPPDIVGTITSVQPSATADGATRVRIEANPADASGSPKMVLAVERETRLLDRRGGVDPRTIAVDALRVGDRVEAWVTGPIMESYPSQGTAETIVVVGDGTPE